MTDAARQEHEALKKKVQPKLSLCLTGNLSRSSVSTPPRHPSGNLTPPVTPPITPCSSFRSSTPTGETRFQVPCVASQWNRCVCLFVWSVSKIFHEPVRRKSQKVTTGCTVYQRRITFWNQPSSRGPLQISELSKYICYFQSVWPSKMLCCLSAVWACVVFILKGNGF